MSSKQVGRDVYTESNKPALFIQFYGKLNALFDRIALEKFPSLYQEGSNSEFYQGFLEAAEEKNDIEAVRVVKEIIASQ